MTSQALSETDQNNDIRSDLQKKTSTNPFNFEQQLFIKEFLLALDNKIDRSNKYYNALNSIGKGDRAAMKRCPSIKDAILLPSVIIFSKKMINLTDERYKSPKYYEIFMCIALLLAKIGAHTEQNEFYFFSDLGVARQTPPILSELRFKSLLKSKTIDDFYINMRRILSIKASSIDAIKFSANVYHWYSEVVLEKNLAIQETMKFRWLEEYYT